jgi:hypothetical protein
LIELTGRFVSHLHTLSDDFNQAFPWQATPAGTEVAALTGKSRRGQGLARKIAQERSY